MTWVLQPGCNCEARNDLRACDDCEDEYICYRCLDFFDIKITLSSEWEQYQGTYLLNASPCHTEEQINNLGSCYANYGSYFDGDLALALTIAEHPYAPGIHFRSIVSSPNNQGYYGQRFSAGSFKMIDPRSCEGHCNGTFIGQRAEGFFTHNVNSWINHVPGDFDLYPDRFWMDDRTDLFQPCDNTCNDKPLYNSSNKDPVSISWELKTREATQIDVNAGRAQNIGDLIQINFPEVLRR